MRNSSLFQVEYNVYNVYCHNHHNSHRLKNKKTLPYLHRRAAQATIQNTNTTKRDI